jgi:outer membrane receptor protein involved in Fe transport
LRTLALLAIALLATNAFAQDGPKTSREAPPASSARIEEIVVRGRSDSLVGVAKTASQGTIGFEQLSGRTLGRPGEVLETVPGMITTQHSGGGKANQFFLRGFNLDHGTDFATSIDDVPVNLPTHGHGQGYTDLNPLIPELVERVSYDKGVYYAEHGDFSSAGAASLEYFDVLPQSLASLEVGNLGYERAVFAASPKLGSGNLLYGVELFHSDGPFEQEDRYKKLNALLRYSQGDESRGWRVTASAYSGDWNASDQLAERAIDVPGFDRFDTLDTSSGGESQRYVLSGEWHRKDASSATRVTVFGFYQNLELFSNFTYFLASPDGDQFEQADRRRVVGTRASHTFFGDLAGRSMENTFGLQVRADWIDNGLFQTVRKRRTEKRDYDEDDETLIPRTTREDELFETSISPYVENKIQWTDKIRTTLGVRADFFRFDSRESERDQSAGSENDAVVSPKATITFGPWASTEFYVSAGVGFHSNDARGVTAQVDPADPLVRTYGSEIGMRTTRISGLQSTLAFWQLRSDSELLFIGDAGDTEASRPSQRQGFEIANYWNVNEYVTVDADFSMSKARFRDSDPVGREIPSSVETVIASGINVHDVGPLSGELRLRYFGPRPLIEDNSTKSGSTLLLSTQLGYQLNERWALSLEVFNLLNRDDDEIDYFYPSRLAGEDAGPDEGGTNDIHSHPADPRSVRLAITARF